MKRFKIWCMICGDKIDIPSDVVIDPEVTLYDTIIWANHNLGCSRCFYLPSFREIRIGVKEIGKELVKNTDEKTTKLIPKERTVRPSGVI